MLDQIRRSRLLGQAVLLLSLVHLVFQVALFAPRELARTDRDRDMIVYHTAARAVLANRALYRAQPGYGPDQDPAAVYIYPPPFAVALAPFGALSFVAFARGWLVLLLGALWVYAYCLACLASSGKAKPVTMRAVLVWGLAVGLWPGSYRALGLGQVDSLLWALFGLGLVGIARSLLWSLAATVKVFYLWPLILLAAQTGRVSLKALLRTFWPALAFVAAFALVSIAVCGAGSYVVWGRDVLPTLSQGNFNADNVSCSMALLRVARGLGWNYTGGPLPPPAHLWLTSASLAAPLVAWYLTRARSIQFQCAWVVLSAILFAPVCWTSYLPLALAPLAVWLGEHNTKSSTTSALQAEPAREAITA